MTAIQDAPSAAPPGLGRSFWRLWTASSLANFTDGIQQSALPLLSALVTRDPVLVAGVFFAQRLPWLFFSPLSGVIVDRMDRRKLMIGATLLRAAVMAVLVVLVLALGPSGWLLAALYLAALIVGMTETVFDNSTLALLPAIVPKDKLDRANSRMFSAQTIANDFAGPPLGSFIFAFSAALPFAAQALGYALAALFLGRIKGEFKAKHERQASWRSIWPDIVEGFRWFLGHRLLRVLALGMGAVSFSVASAFAVYVLYAVELLGLSEAQFGLLLAAGGFGGLLSGVLTDRVVKHLGPGTAILGGSLLMAASLALLGSVQDPLLAAAIAAMISFAAITINVPLFTFRQSVIPDRLLGRVTSAFRMFGVGASALGALAGGVIADLFGLTAPFWFGCAIICATVPVIAPYVNNSRLAAARAEAEAG